MGRGQFYCDSSRKCHTVSLEDIHDISPTEVDPRPTDVLLGRGKGVASWKGNVFFRQIIWESREQYKLAGRFTKAKVAEDIIKAIASLHPPGRFVEIVEEDVYCLVSPERALEKTCQALREKKTSAQPTLDPRFFIYESHNVSTSPHSFGAFEHKANLTAFPESISCSTAMSVKLVDMPRDLLAPHILQSSDRVFDHLSASAVVASANLGVKKKRKKTAGNVRKKRICIPVPRQKKSKSSQRSQTAAQFSEQPSLVSPATSTIPWEWNTASHDQDTLEDFSTLVPTTLDFGVDMFPGGSFLLRSCSLPGPTVHDIGYGNACPKYPKIPFNISSRSLEELHGLSTPLSSLSRSGDLEKRQSSGAGVGTCSVCPIGDEPNLTLGKGTIERMGRSHGTPVTNMNASTSCKNSCGMWIFPDKPIHNFHQDILTSQSQSTCNSFVIPDTSICTSVLLNVTGVSFVFDDTFGDNVVQEGKTEGNENDDSTIMFRCFSSLEEEDGDSHDVDDEFLLTTMHDCLF